MAGQAGYDDVCMAPMVSGHVRQFFLHDLLALFTKLDTDGK